MNDRLVTLLGALGALALFIALVMPPGAEPDISRPVSPATGANGYRGLELWMADSGVVSHSLKRRLTEIDSLGFPATGNLLITTMPHEQAMRSDEVQMLKRWVAEGNTLLVMAALDDTPDWTLSTESDNFLAGLERLTGMSFTALLDDDDEVLVVGDFLNESAMNFVADPVHPMMSGVTRLQGVTDAPTSIWQPDFSLQFYLTLVAEEETGTAALWEIPWQDGRMIVSASASLFTNRALGEADNAQLFANIVAFHLAPGGVVIFDDMHQGLSELYDPEAFFSDARLGASVLFVLAFWLVYVVGTSGRLVLPRSRQQMPRQSDLVRAIGGFMARKLSRSSAGRMMIEGWLAELHTSGRISATNQTAWQELAAMPLVDREVLAAVNAAHAQLGEGRKVDLAELHNHLQTLRRTLA